MMTICFVVRLHKHLFIFTASSLSSNSLQFNQVFTLPLHPNFSYQNHQWLLINPRVSSQPLSYPDLSVAFFIVDNTFSLIHFLQLFFRVLALPPTGFLPISLLTLSLSILLFFLYIQSVPWYFHPVHVMGKFIFPVQICLLNLGLVYPVAYSTSSFGCRLDVANSFRPKLNSSFPPNMCVCSF